MLVGSPCVADSIDVEQDILRFLQIPKVHYCSKQNPSLIIVQSQANSAHVSISRLFRESFVPRPSLYTPGTMNKPLFSRSFSRIQHLPTVNVGATVILSKFS
jgi:hypothetical protein